MRYIKVLILAIFIFLCLIFFFQNQAPLSQEMTMSLNLFFIPTMTSIALPFYFLLMAAFFLGAILCWLLLIWDRLNIMAKATLLRRKLREQEKKINKLQDIIDKQNIREEKALAISSAKAAHPELSSEPHAESLAGEDAAREHETRE